MKRNCVWVLSAFCRFYGRVVPANNVGNNKFNKFHTSYRNCDDLYVNFDESIEPMDFMSLLACASSYYVVGSGDVEEDWDGRCFFENYTLHNRESLEKYLSTYSYKGDIQRIFRNLDSVDQSLIDIKPQI